MQAENGSQNVWVGRVLGAGGPKRPLREPQEGPREPPEGPQETPWGHRGGQRDPKGSTWTTAGSTENAVGAQGASGASPGRHGSGFYLGKTCIPAFRSKTGHGASGASVFHPFVVFHRSLGGVSTTGVGTLQAGPGAATRGPGQVQDKSAKRSSRGTPPTSPSQSGRGKTDGFRKRPGDAVCGPKADRQPFGPLKCRTWSPREARKDPPESPKRRPEPRGRPKSARMTATFAENRCGAGGPGWGKTMVSRKFLIFHRSPGGFSAIEDFLGKMSVAGEKQWFLKSAPLQKNDFEKTDPRRKALWQGKNTGFSKNDVGKTTSARKMHERQKTPIWTPKSCFVEAAGTPKGPPPGSQKSHRGAQDATRDVQVDDPEGFVRRQ